MSDKKAKKQVDFFSSKLLAALEHSSALEIAFEAQSKSADVGFDFKNIELVMDKVQEECKEVKAAFEERKKNLSHFHEEIGDCLFVLVNLCRHAGVNPEELLRDNTKKYLLRCKYIEDHLLATDRKWSDLDLSEIYALWKAAKFSGL